MTMHMFMRVFQPFFRERLVLADGRSVLIRPIRPDDAPRLIDAHAHLSLESRYLRFFSAKPRLTPGEARWLAEVDFVRRFALVATVEHKGREHIVAVARFDIGADGAAESAVVVGDPYQHAGLGTALLERLNEVARGRRVRAVTGVVLPENAPMLGLLHKQGAVLERTDDGLVHVRTPLRTAS
jgi:GNAT superfamily N-acetyltransferase